MKRKRITYILCPLIFLALCAAVIWFLQMFTVSDETMTYIGWESAVRVEEDGTEQPIEIPELTNTPEAEDKFRFTGALPGGLTDGYLLFETADMELTLYLDGEEVYSSSVALSESNSGIAQAQLPLPADSSGSLTAECTIRSGSGALFPPHIRFLPSGMEDRANMAYANLYGIPAGISALAFLLAAGLFLLTIIWGHAEFSLIPLAISMAGMLVYRISHSYGYYFLPAAVTNVLSQQWIGLLTLAALLVYLLMNRKREFWKYLGAAAACSAGTLAVCWAVSSAHNGRLASYLISAFTDLFHYGIYDGLLYWTTLWLAVVCALISAYRLMRSFVLRQAETKALLVKNRLILDDYRIIEQKMRDSAEQRHEWKHQLTALEALYLNQDYEGIGAFLENMKKQEGGIAQTRFTENITVNLILQDYSARAARIGAAFDAQAFLPKDLAVPEEDLCILLMNMLDNALEASARVESPGKRFVRFRTRIKNGYMTVKCENAFEGELKKAPDGQLATTKSDPQAHGFGISQMRTVAEKYHSLLDISCPGEHIFSVQTALKLPVQAARTL